MESSLSFLDHARRYGDEESCRIALAEMRWSDGFVCRHCGGTSAYHVADSEMSYRSCLWRTSLTAGTILHRSHLPLTTWFTAAYLVTSGQGTNSLVLGEQIGVENSRTPHFILQRFRMAMGGALTAPLTGMVEADETLVGGVSPGAKGRTTAGTHKKMVLVLAERRKTRDRIRDHGQKRVPT